MKILNIENLKTILEKQEQSFDWNVFNEIRKKYNKDLFEEYLRDLLENNNSVLKNNTHLALIYTLGKIGDEKSIILLCDILKCFMDNEEVVLETLDSIGNLANSNDYESRSYVISTLKELIHIRKLSKEVLSSIAYVLRCYEVSRFAEKDVSLFSFSQDEIADTIIKLDISILS